MLIDFRRKFLFIKTNKTAGTSLEIALSKIMGVNESIITPITSEDEALRREFAGLGPCGFRRPWICPQASEALEKTGNQDFSEFYNHMSYGELARLLGRELVNSFWSFGFTRHPYDRALSMYTYRHRLAPGFGQFSLAVHQDNFQAMLQQGVFFSTSCHLGSSGPDQVNRVFRYEELAAALQEICSKLAVDPRMILPLPRAKVRYGQQLLPFPRRAILTLESRRLIEQICAWEFTYAYHSESPWQPGLEV